MHSRAAALPELEQVRSEPVATPIGRSRHRRALVGIPCGDLREPFFQDGATVDRRALRRCPCAETRQSRPGRKIGVRFRGAHALGHALDSHLPLELDPEEEQRRPRIARQLAAFAAVVVREKHEAARVRPLQQDDSGCRSVIVGHGRERHRVGLGQLRGNRFVEPAGELSKRIAIDVTLVERGALVLRAQLCGIDHVGRTPSAPPRQTIRGSMASGAAAVGKSGTRPRAVAAQLWQH